MIWPEVRDEGRRTLDGMAFPRVSGTLEMVCTAAIQIAPSSP